MNGHSKTSRRTLPSGCLAGIVWLIAAITPAASNAAPLRIMPLGDSITAGYTDNPPSGGTGGWTVPFEFGYRRQLYHLLESAGYDFTFVGQSQEPFVSVYGDPTHGGTVSPTFDLRDIEGYNYGGHRGYGGRNITTTTNNIVAQMNADNPDIILLMIGINGISANSMGQLDTLVTTIFATKPGVRLIVAEITPYAQSTIEPYATRNTLIVDYNTYIRDVLVPKFTAQGRSVSRVNQHRNFLSNPDNPSSETINALYSNNINHPTNAAYDSMAQTWFDGVLAILPPPATPTLDADTFPADIQAGTAIGILSITPQQFPEAVTFGFAAGPGDSDNSKFIISGNQLRAGNHTFGADPSGTTYRIRIKVTGNTSGTVGNQTFLLGTTPEDSDEDGIPDLWELGKTGGGDIHSGNLTDLADPGDFDKDGLSDLAEYQLSIISHPDIDPTKPDTDGDGLLDGEEISGAGQRPPTNPARTDTDGDGIGDLNEDNTGIHQDITRTGTNPVIADTDNDGLNDGAEILLGSLPLDASSPSPPVVQGVSSLNPGTYATDVSTTDLLHGLSGTNITHSGWYLNNSASPLKLNDGLHGPGVVPVEGAWSQPENSVITFSLPDSAGSGWDITGITTIADWPGGAFANQHYRISVQRIGQDHFSPLATVNFQPFTASAAGASKVMIGAAGNILARAVTRVRFDMLSTNGVNARSVYREFDVFGLQSSVPNPRILRIEAPSLPHRLTSLMWLSWPGKTYRIERSPTLTDWQVVDETHPSGGVTTFFRRSSGLMPEAEMFYRIMPNP